MLLAFLYSITEVLPYVPIIEHMPELSFAPLKHHRLSHGTAVP